MKSFAQGVKFYVGLTLAKELVGDALGRKRHYRLVEGIWVKYSPEYQRNIEQKSYKDGKNPAALEFFEKGMDFKEKTKVHQKRSAKLVDPKQRRRSLVVLITRIRLKLFFKFNIWNVSGR